MYSLHNFIYVLLYMLNYSIVCLYYILLYISIKIMDMCML